MRLISILVLTIASAFSQVYSGFIRTDLKIEPGNTAPLAGDFTGDGVPDLVIHTATEIRVYPGKGNGQTAFGAPLRTPLGLIESRTLPHAAASADFNSDGKLDLFAFGRLFLGNGDGTLHFLTDIIVQDQPQVIDFNSDGIPDLFGRLKDTTTYGLMRGTRNTKFDEFYGDAIVSYFPNHVAAVADINRDGTFEVVTGGGTFQGRPIDVFSSWFNLSPNCMGAVGPPAPNCLAKVTPGGLGNSIQIADFTGDGIPDILTNASLAARGLGMSLIVGRGDGTFATAVAAMGSCEFGPNCEYTDFTTSDIDRDGKLDMAMLLASSTGGIQLIVSPGAGTGTFFPPWTSVASSATGSKYVALGDWNGDGKPELAIDDGTSVILFSHDGTSFALSSASGSRIVSPGSLVTLYGSALSEITASAPSLSDLPTTLGGVQLRVENLASYFEDYLVELLYVSPTQINFRLPLDQPISQRDLGRLRLIKPREEKVVGMVSMEAGAVAVFTVDGNRAVANVTSVGNGLLLTLYATGLHSSTSALSVRVLIGDQSFTPESFSPSEEVTGLDIVRVVLPRQACANTSCASLDLKNVRLSAFNTYLSHTSNLVAVTEEVH